MYVDNAAQDTAGRATGMTVSPDMVIRLKQGLEAQVENVRTWLRRNREPLRAVAPPGNDPCSRDTVDLLSLNGQEAIDAVWAYVDQLTSIIDKLQASADSYGLIEDEQVARFCQESL